MKAIIVWTMEVCDSVIPSAKMTMLNTVTAVEMARDRVAKKRVK